MLDTELVALGGYPELLFFGSLSLLLSSWLALSHDQYAPPRKKLLRLLVYMLGSRWWTWFLERFPYARFYLVIRFVPIIVLLERIIERCSLILSSRSCNWSISAHRLQSECITQI